MFIRAVRTHAVAQQSNKNLIVILTRLKLCVTRREQQLIEHFGILLCSFRNFIVKFTRGVCEIIHVSICTTEQRRFDGRTKIPLLKFTSTQ